VPIIAVTAYALGGDRDRCIAAGMDGFVSKPLDATELRDAIASSLEESGRAEPERRDGGETHHVNRDEAMKDTPPTVARQGDKAREEEAPAADGTECLDVEDLLRRCMRKAEVMEKVLRKFSETGPEGMKRICRALSSGSAEDTAREAHALKGAAGNLSAARLRSVAERIETAAKRRDLELAWSYLEELRGEFEKCLADIAAVLSTVTHEQC
jgi:HPt (histidine-containing phosphotransfer) domain-containing protein